MQRIASPGVGLGVVFLLLGCTGGADPVAPPEAVTAPEPTEPEPTEPEPTEPEPTEPESTEPEDDDRDEPDATVACAPAVLEAIDAAIAGQLDAFAADDYDAALGFASAPFRANTDLASFRALIQEAYPRLIDDATHRSVACRQLEPSRAQLRVQVTGADGGSEDLLYLMVAEGPDRWSIDAAATLEGSDAAVI